MYVVRLDMGHPGGAPVTMWLSSVVPRKLSDRDQAMRFESKGEARRAAEAAKLVGWTLEDA